MYKFVTALILLVGCYQSTEPKPKRTAADRQEMRTLFSSGLSRECLTERIVSEQAKLEDQIQADLQTLKQMGVLVDVKPTSGPLGATERMVVDRRVGKPEFPKPTVDILNQLDIKIENEFNGELGITDDVIRGLADASYERLGIADPSIEGWTLSIRSSDTGAMTAIDKDRKLAIVMISMPEMLGIGAAVHELTHVLATGSMTGNDNVIRIATEYVAIAGETNEPPQLREEFSYARNNLAILGMGKSINGQSGFVHANGAPLDGWRYDVMRMTDEVIGEDGQIKLAKQLYEHAREHGSLSLDEMQSMFVEAGITDLAIFNQQTDPGLYLDLTFTKSGMAVVLAKTVDEDGYEGITQTPMQFVWRDANGQAMASNQPMPLQPALTIMDAPVLSPYAATLEVRVAGQPYKFQLEAPSTETTTSSSKPVHSVRGPLAP